MSLGGHFDLKLGYSCNNNCIHCVVKTNAEEALSKNEKFNLSYAEVLENIESEDCRNASSIVLTGGEPTIRREFMRILKYIVSKYPNKNICIQTNGRRLGDYLEEIKALNQRISFVIAVHSSDEALHNQVVGNSNEKSNPFQETIDSLKKLQEVYGGFKNARVEIVLSKLNYKSLPQTLEDLYGMGITHIGISYPHMDGFYHCYGADTIREVGFSYEELRKVLPAVHDLAQKYPELFLTFEEVPLCMWRNENGKLYSPLLNLKSFESQANRHVTVKYPNRKMDSDFSNEWVQMHRYPVACENCASRYSCPGVWEEAYAVFGEQGFTPITLQELETIG